MGCSVAGLLSMEYTPLAGVVSLPSMKRSWCSSSTGPFISRPLLKFPTVAAFAVRLIIHRVVQVVSALAFARDPAADLRRDPDGFMAHRIRARRIDIPKANGV